MADSSIELRVSTWHGSETLLFENRYYYVGVKVIAVVDREFKSL